MEPIILRNGTEFNIAELSEPDALMVAIGRYVVMFAKADRILAELVAQIMRINGPHIRFLWRDAGFRTKTRAVRRAARESLGDKDTQFQTLTNLLNRLENRSNYRNDLMHGAFAADTGGIYLGRLGDSFTDAAAGFRKIDHASVLQETEELRKIIDDLEAWDCR